ncbi:MAG TPA: glycosyltransferase family 4 protein [Opitutaceae bacterium]|nr:glycosyltransferase family 4 protein [Opitutaceae bacterium]
MNPTGRLRILHADTDDLENPLRGGQPVRTFAVNSRMASRHDITVFTSVYKNCQQRMERSGVRYRRLGFRLPPFGLSPHLSFLTALGPAIARTPHDLVIEEFTPPVGFCGLPWWTKGPVVLSVQWYFFDQWEKRYHLPFSRWMRRLAKTGRYRHVIVQSDVMGREMRSLLPDATIRRIPSGIDDSAFIESQGAGEYVLFLGRLDIEHKGLDLLIEAWRKVCGPAKIPLVIAGEGPDRTAIEAMIAREKLGGLVRLIGRVEGPAKQEALRRCRLFVMPSRYETFGIVGIEAMAASKPVVCFDIDSLNELAAPPWAENIEKFDCEALGLAVARLWQNPEHCQAMGEQARRRAQDYRWDAIARQQEDFYLEITSSTPGHETTQNSRLLPVGIP